MNPRPAPDRRLCVAPMMARTDRHCRYFLRLISRRVMLYTEMIAVGALLRGDAERHLRFDPAEHPVGLQLGGGEPAELARCAEMAERYGYDEINLNAGCPSGRVSSGGFGACLMLRPRVAAACVKAMREHCALPVTVKCRLGVDERDRYRDLACFAETLAANGCRVFIVHARKAHLSGLSPRQNREIPPLRHDRVYRLKRDFPELEIILNGGVESLRQCRDHARRVDGVMLGRAVTRDPWLLAAADREIFGDDEPPRSKAAVARDYLRYIRRQSRRGDAVAAMAGHLAACYQGRPGARAFRRYLGEHACRRDAGMEAVERAMSLVSA